MEWLVKFKGTEGEGTKIRANTLWDAKKFFLKRNWKKYQKDLGFGDLEAYHLTELFGMVDAKNANDHRKKLSVIEEVVKEGV